MWQGQYAIDSLGSLSSEDSLGLCGIHIPGTLVVLSSHQTSHWSTVFDSVILIKCVGLHRNWIPASWPPPWQRLHPFLSRQSPFVYFVPVPSKKKKNHVSPPNFPWNGLSYRMCFFFSLIFWQFIVSFIGSISAPTHTKLEPGLSQLLMFSFHRMCSCVRIHEEGKLRFRHFEYEEVWYRELEHH